MSAGTSPPGTQSNVAASPAAFVKGQLKGRTLFAALNATESCPAMVTVAVPSPRTETVGPVHEPEWPDLLNVPWMTSQ